MSTPKDEQDELLLAQRVGTLAFETPPHSPQKATSFETPSPAKTASQFVRSVKVTPSKITFEEGESLIDGVESTYIENLDPQKGEQIRKRLFAEISPLFFKGKSPISPKGHEYAVGYSRSLEWVDELLRLFHKSEVETLLLFDVEHIVSGERVEKEGIGKLAGKHFFQVSNFKVWLKAA